jgi:hypothetical protein
MIQDDLAQYRDVFEGLIDRIRGSL